MIASFGAFAAFLLCAAVPPVQLVLSDVDKIPGKWSGVDAAQGRSGKAARFVVDKPGKPCFCSLDYSAAGTEGADWDVLAFDYRISAPGLSWWGVKLVDYPLGGGRQVVLRITDPNLLRPGRWHTARLKLSKPDALWGAAGNRSVQVIIFRAVLSANAPEPVTILIDNVRFEGAPVLMRAIAEAPPKLRGRRLEKIWRVRATNRGREAVTLVLRAQPLDPGLIARVDPQRPLKLAPGQSIEATVTLALQRPETAPRLKLFRASLRAVSGREVLGSMEVSLTTPLGKPEHPLLLITRAEVPKVLERAKRDKDMEATLRWLLRNADSWVAKKVEIPDRGGQWWHWYTCKKCGGRLEPISPTRHRCRRCGAEYSGWPYDDVYITMLHGRLSGAARDLAAAYLLTGEAKYADKAREILLGYAAKYLTYELHDVHGRKGRGGRVGAQTLDEATWLIRIVQAFDAIRDRLSEEDIATIRDKLLLPAAQVAWSERMPIHNISCWRNTAYLLVGLALDREDMVRQALNGPSGLRNQLEEGVIPPGVWYEGAWGYHFYTLNALLPAVQACKRAHIDFPPPQYKQMYMAPLHFVAPDGLLPAFNDSGYSSIGGTAWMYAIAYGEYGDPLMAWAAQKGSRRRLEVLLWGSDRPLKAAEPSFDSELLPEAGYAILRTGTWAKPAGATMPPNYAVIDFGPHGGGHGHPDKLSFMLWLGGTLIGSDAGSISYGNPMHGGYYRRTLAHNTVVVDGRSQAPCTGEFIFFADGRNTAAAGTRTDAAYPGVELVRVCALSGSRFIDVYWALSESEHTYDWIFRGKGEFSCSVETKPAEKPPEGEGWNWCRQIRQAQLAAGQALRATWRVDDVAATLVHVPTADETLFTAVAPDQPAGTTLHFIALRQRGRDALWVAAIDGAHEDAAVRLLPVKASGGADRRLCCAVEVQGGGERDLVLVNLSGKGAVEAAGARLEGYFGLVHYSGQELREALVAAKAKLWVKGKLVE